MDTSKPQTSGFGAQLHSVARRSQVQLLHLGSGVPGTRPEFLDFPENRQGKEQVVFSGEGWRDPKLSLALEQPRLAPVQPRGCPRARDNFGTPRPSPEKTTCSFPCRFSGNPGIRALYQARRIPMLHSFVARHLLRGSLTCDTPGS